MLLRHESIPQWSAARSVSVPWAQKWKDFTRIFSCGARANSISNTYLVEIAFTVLYVIFLGLTSFDKIIQRLSSSATPRLNISTPTCKPSWPLQLQGIKSLNTYFIIRDYTVKTMVFVLHHKGLKSSPHYCSVKRKLRGIKIFPYWCIFYATKLGDYETSPRCEITTTLRLAHSQKYSGAW